MILPKLRTNLDIMLSPVRDRPGLLIRDFFRYSEATLIVPPLLIPGLLFFDGTRTDLDLQTELTRSLGSPEIGNTVGHLIQALSRAGFLEDETYAKLKLERRLAFSESPVLQAAHAGSAYPQEIGPLRDLMQQYLGLLPCGRAFDRVSGDLSAGYLRSRRAHTSASMRVIRKKHA
jgi:hypothetical protein